MTPENRRLVQQSWNEVAKSAERASEVFYRHLLEADPQLERLFRNADPRERGRTLTRELSQAVRELAALPDGGRIVVDAAQGFENPHFAGVGNALLAMLQEVLGPRFTASAATAWVDCFRWLAPRVRRAALGETGLPRMVSSRLSRLVAAGS
jgi:hemoglobin-like flavoprotein